MALLPGTLGKIENVRGDARDIRTIGRFVLNPHATREIALSPEAKAALLAQAERAAEKAREIAPVVTGDYRDSIRAVLVRGKYPRLVAGDAKVRYATVIEFGGVNGNQHPQAILRRGTELAGLSFRKRLGTREWFARTGGE